jgi:hypothetical protein
VKVLLVVIDAASPRVFCPAVQTGRLKHLQRLADAGEMHPASVSIFPSITPAATAAIITGCYPSQHGIVGASWYDERSGQVAYYGDDFWVAAARGFGPFLRDFLVHLNGDRLTAPTLFELVEHAGREAACFNYLVYRGLKEHRVNIPWLLAALPGMPLAETVHGPTILCLGDFVSDGQPHPRHPRPHGALHRFGMDDAGTASLLCRAAAAGKWPDFTVAYFADNDYRSHEVGPAGALPVLDRVDAALGATLDAAGGIDRFLAETCVIVTSDHGHCDILENRAEAVIRVDDLFSEFAKATLGEPWKDGDDIMVCPNMRAAQVYLHPSTMLGASGRSSVEEVVRAALRDARIDLVMWCTGDTHATQRYHVAGPRGALAFWRHGGGGRQGRDAQGTAWRWDGDGAVLRLDACDGMVHSSDYPNAFERIAGALDARAAGEVWLTAQPGCEFEARGGKPHVGGGSHGALHALDSLSPVICAGTPVRLPRSLRSIDLAALCTRALGLAPHREIGAPALRD